MSTTVGDSRLNKFQWTPEEDALLAEVVCACESFRWALHSPIHLNPIQPTQGPAGIPSREVFLEGRASPAGSAGFILSIHLVVKVRVY